MRTEAVMRTESLTRPANRVIAGVCAGLASHLGVSVVTVRLIMAGAGVLGGAGVLMYLWLWAMAPNEQVMESGAPGGQGGIVDRSGRMGDRAPSMPQAGQPHQRLPLGQGMPIRTRRPLIEALIGGSLLLVALVLIANQTGADIPVTIVVPLIVLGLGTALVWMQLIRTERERTWWTVARTIAGILLVVGGGLLFFFSNTAGQWWGPAAAAVIVLAGVALAVAPIAVRMWTNAVADRALAARESERAAIAAHLHDSVLQTLALIQREAGQSSEPARLARVQERELREWLFAGERTPRQSLEGQLRTTIDVLEQRYPAHLTLVSAGPGLLSADASVAAEAIAEAMLNAAKHAGGEISVYVEVRDGEIEAFVRDHGPGFDLDGVPADRLGVRESIIGRVTRHGGTATIKRAEGSGTEVHLQVPRTEDAASAAAPSQEARAVDEQ